MKNIILYSIFLFYCCSGTAIASTRIQNSYVKIRNRIIRHNLEKTVPEGNNVLEDLCNRLNYKDTDDEKLIERLCKDSSVDISIRGNRFDINNKFLNRFNFEKELWDFEQSLLHETEVLPRYSNEVMTDSLFDHIENWNIIDEILFDDKNSETKASFGKNTLRFSEKKEDWQIGDPRQGGKAISESTDYSYFNSIASEIYHIKKLLEEKLNIKPLLTEVNNKMIFETTVMPPHKPKEDPVFLISLPSIKKLIPEVSELKIEKFVGIENVLLEEFECAKIVTPSSSASNQIKDKILSDCRTLRQTLFKLNNEGLSKTGDIKQYIDNGYHLSSNLELMDDNFWAFYLEVKEFKRLLKNISESPKI